MSNTQNRWFNLLVMRCAGCPSFQTVSPKITTSKCARRAATKKQNLPRCDARRVVTPHHRRVKPQPSPHNPYPPGTKVEKRERRRECIAEVKRRARRIETIRMLKKTGCEPHLANILPFCYILKSRVAGTRALEQCIPSCAPRDHNLIPDHQNNTYKPYKHPTQSIRSGHPVYDISAK